MNVFSEHVPVKRAIDSGTINESTRLGLVPKNKPHYAVIAGIVREVAHSMMKWQLDGFGIAAIIAWRSSGEIVILLSNLLFLRCDCFGMCGCQGRISFSFLLFQSTLIR